MSVAVQIGKRQASRGTRGAEGGAGLEAAAAVVEEDEVAGAIVSHRDVQVSVAIEIGEGDGVGTGLFIPQPPREGEGGPPVVEEDPVLPGPVATVGDDDIEGTIAVHVAQAHRRSQIAARAQGPQWAERPILLAGQRSHGEWVGEVRGDEEESHQAWSRRHCGLASDQIDRHL